MRAAASEDAHYFQARALRETEKAILVQIGKDELWIPKSCLHDDSEVFAEDDEGECAVKLWWAEKEGLV
jgi:hypothetical protein